MNCTKRKREYRIHEMLSNGQWLNLYFTKYPDNTGFNVWTTGLCISNKIKVANDWMGKNGKSNRKLKGRSTGKCGIEGLKKALEYICRFADNLKANEELQVGWADDKRKYAYRILFKYGFFVDEVMGFYHSRNLNIWQNNNPEDNSKLAYRKKVMAHA